MRLIWRPIIGAGAYAISSTGRCSDPLGSMPETQKQWIKRLQKAGWKREAGGNHQTKMTKPGHRPITLPEHKGQVYEGTRIRD